MCRRWRGPWGNIRQREKSSRFTQTLFLMKPFLIMIFSTPDSMSAWLWSFCRTQGAVGGEARPDQGWTCKRSRAREEIGRATAKRPGQARGFIFILFVFVLFLIFYLLVQARLENTILMKYSSGLFRVAGLRSYQGEFTFSGLEDHLFSELRRFRSGKDEVPEKLHFLVFVDFLFKRLFFFVISFCTFQPAFNSSTSRLSREFSSSEKRWRLKSN